MRDLTYPMWQANPAGTNGFEPHPWGGVAGILKQFTDAAALQRIAALQLGFQLPEPPGWALIVLAAAGLYGARRRMLQKL